MILKIKRPTNPSEFKEIEAIQRDAWGAADITITPHHLTTAIALSNNCIFMAYVDNKAAGFVFGFLGFEKNSKNTIKIILHSHQLGVRKQFQNMNIGYILKLKQREYAIRHNIDIIKWTFDPLQSKNAYFNFNKLGVVSNQYIENLYGFLDDELNKDIPTDRLYVTWYINSYRVRQRIYKKVRPPSADTLLDSIISITKTHLKEHILLLTDYDYNVYDEYLLVEFPSNINYIKKKALRIALEWRYALRTIFNKYLKRGYSVIDVVISKKPLRTFYVLGRGPPEKFVSVNWWENL